MKKIYQGIVSILLIVIVAVALYYWDYILETLNVNPALVYSIMINIFVYIGRTIVIRILNYTLGTRKIRFVLVFIINIIWIVFVFELIFVISPQLGVAIVSFLVVAISLTMEDRINTITSGIMLLSSSAFDIGDLIEANETQGIVTEINLSYTKIRDFLGIFTYIPNTAVYNASIKKFTQKLSRLPSPEEEEEVEKQGYKKWIKKVEDIIVKEGNFTRYIKVVEVPYSVDLEHLGDLLEEVFDKYEKRLGIRPYYYANTTAREHLSITLQILSKNPQLVLRHSYPFIKDVLYALMSEEVMAGSKNQTEGGGK